MVATKINQNAAQVPIRSPWASKINWTSALGGAAALVTGFSGLLPPDKAAMVGAGLTVAQSVATMIFRTYFNDSVTPQSIEK